MVFGAVLAACGSSGNPISFTDQPGSLPDSISQYSSRLGVDDPDQVPLVQRNFLEGCMTGDTPRLEGLEGSALADACGCSYNDLVQYLVGNSASPEAAFDTFVSINRAVKDQSSSDTGSPIGSQYLELFQACSAG
jgi:hypothetical protein